MDHCNGFANMDHVTLEQRLTDAVAQATSAKDKVEESRILMHGTVQAVTALLARSTNAATLQVSLPGGSIGCTHVLD